LIQVIPNEAVGATHLAALKAESSLLKARNAFLLSQIIFRRANIAYYLGTESCAG
jgi:hypothetical protein